MYLFNLHVISRIPYKANLLFAIRLKPEKLIIDPVSRSIFQMLYCVFQFRCQERRLGFSTSEKIGLLKQKCIMYTRVYMV